MAIDVNTGTETCMNKLAFKDVFALGRKEIEKLNLVVTRKRTEDRKAREEYVLQERLKDSIESGALSLDLSTIRVGPVSSLGQTKRHNDYSFFLSRW